MERDVALFRQTKNMVEPRFRVQGRGEALVARCRRYSAMLSELRFMIVTAGNSTIYSQLFVDRSSTENYGERYMYGRIL